MVRSLLIRGMLVGMLAGLLVFGFARVFGEPAVDRAIGFESAADEARAKADEARGVHVEAEPELVSRSTQAGWGLLVGVTVYATAFGGLFALVFAAVNGRAAPIGPRATAALLAACGFVCVYVVPNLKYPANPPAIGEPETIGQRTALYFVMLAASLGAMLIAGVVRARLARRSGGWNAALVAGAVYLAAVVAVAAVLPRVDEVPAEFPAAVLWQFRVASWGMQLIMWTTLGLGFGAAAEAAMRGDGARGWVVPARG